jgi:hypothetical protein
VTAAAVGGVALGPVALGPVALGLTRTIGRALGAGAAVSAFALTGAAACLAR